MGCDIHLFVRVKVIDVLVDGEAPLVGEPKSEWRWMLAPSGLDEYESAPTYQWDIGRSYRLFAPLAGVRDYSDEGVLPSLRHHRGLPPDVGRVEGIEIDGERYWLGDHSYTYFTLAEMLADPVWGQYVSERGDEGTWRELSDWWFSDILPRLRALGTDDQVQLVLGFDN